MLEYIYMEYNPRKAIILFDLIIVMFSWKLPF